MATPTVITPKVLKTGTQLTASTVLEYTVPASTVGLGVIIQLMNPRTNAVAYKVTVYVQPSGASNDAAADMFLEYTVPPDGVQYQFFVGNMQTGDFIRAVCATASKVNFRLVGDEGT